MPPDTLRLLNATMLGSSSFPQIAQVGNSPYNMGIITALKKRFKYLYLKDVLDFYELDEEAKLQKKMQGRRLQCDATGVAYGNPAHRSML